MKSLNTEHIKKRVAIISHPDKKVDLINWSYENSRMLKQHELVAPRSTAAILEGTIHMFVHKLPEMEDGGDKEVMRMILEGKIDVMVFLWDPLMASTYGDIIPALMLQSIEANVMVACNIPTANLVLSSSEPVTSQQEKRAPAYWNPGLVVEGRNRVLNAV